MSDAGSLPVGKDDVVFVTALEPLKLAGDALLAIVRTWDSDRHWTWLESYVQGHVKAAGEPVWWVHDVNGWDLFLRAMPSHDLIVQARFVDLWRGRGASAVPVRIVNPRILHDFELGRVNALLVKPQLDSEAIEVWLVDADRWRDEGQPEDCVLARLKPREFCDLAWCFGCYWERLKPMITGVFAKHGLVHPKER